MGGGGGGVKTQNEFFKNPAMFANHYLTMFPEISSPILAEWVTQCHTAESKIDKYLFCFETPGADLTS